MSLQLGQYPQLRLIAWNRQPDDLVDEAEAFALYEANWRFVDEASLLPQELELIQRLTREFGAGVLNV